MIRSPSGQLNVTAQSGFPLENSETHRSQEIDTSIVPSTSSSNTNTDNQLVWSSRIRNSLNPQITQQITKVRFLGILEALFLYWDENFRNILNSKASIHNFFYTGLQTNILA